MHMDPSHQTLLLECQSALQTLVDDLAAEQRATAKRQKSEQMLEELRYKRCGIVVEQLVSDVLALIVCHLELAKDMRVFRLTCTYWNQAFCDNTQLFDNHFWVSHYPKGWCLSADPALVSALQNFHPFERITPLTEVTLFRNFQGCQDHIEFRGFQYRQMKDTLWMETIESGVTTAVGRYESRVPLLRIYNNLRETGESGPYTLQFSLTYAAGFNYICCTLSGNCVKLHFPDPCQTNLLAIQQQVIRRIATARSVNWYVPKHDVGELDEQMQQVARSWREAIVQRNNASDKIV